MKKTTLAILASAALTVSLSARDQIKMVGSSTVYPFASAVAEELGATTKYPTPVVESTGSGGGMKLFCAGNGMNTPDITNASRRMKAKEFKMCEKNGVTDITEAVIGFDGIAFAQSNSNKPFSVTKKQLALAVAAEVPGKNGKLIDNPYKKWSDIDSSLPNREIIIYGPPKSSGTRDAFEDMVLKATFKKMDEYTSLYKKDKKKYKAYKKYHKVRQDGIYVPSGENDNLIVQKLNKNKDAFGIFGYSFLVENEDKLIGAKINGVMPTPDAISSGEYPISRSLFFYIKNSHEKDVPAMKDYVKMFMDDMMIGEEGILTEIGLIPLPKAKRAAIKASVTKREKVTLDSLKH
ncbi:PstS family phosphate ABC transporter substrate-binding protein [Malaciobacter halophilus]|uniref:PstS family phosphate ABC transporter substrate-binding protein n=1 Tax=Malaciobacter halophilus TaxID=197482 RepID=UPI0039174509